MELNRRKFLAALGAALPVALAPALGKGSASQSTLAIKELKSSLLDINHPDSFCVSPTHDPLHPNPFGICTGLTGTRDFWADGNPRHATGDFPNQNNPEPITYVGRSFHVTRTPQFTGVLTPLQNNNVTYSFGLGLNGIPFDPSGPWWRKSTNFNLQFEAMAPWARLLLGLDWSNAHTQDNGKYHYHGSPTGMINRLQQFGFRPNQMMIIGWAADGFPIYAAEGSLAGIRSSYHLKPGARPATEPWGAGGWHDGTFVQDYEYVAGSGDLDECNGRWGATPEFPHGMYYYVVTKTFPFVPRFFRGAPHDSFMNRVNGQPVSAVGASVPAPLQVYPQSWQVKPGAAFDVGVGPHGQVFVIGTDRGVYRWNGGGWDWVGGANCARIAVDVHGVVWVVTTDNHIWTFHGGSGQWHLMPGWATDVATGGDGTIWATSGGNSLWWWNGGGWSQVSNGGIAIGNRLAIALDNQPVVSDSSNRIWKRNSWGGWDLFPPLNASVIDIGGTGPDGSVFVTAIEPQFGTLLRRKLVYRYVPAYNWWIEFGGINPGGPEVGAGAESISCGGDHPWFVSDRAAIYRLS